MLSVRNRNSVQDVQDGTDLKELRALLGQTAGFIIIVASSSSVHLTPTAGGFMTDDGAVGSYLSPVFPGSASSVPIYHIGEQRHIGERAGSFVSCDKRRRSHSGRLPCDRAHTPTADGRQRGQTASLQRLSAVPHSLMMAAARLQWRSSMF